MSAWSVETLNPQTGAVERHPLPLAAPGERHRLRLRALPGARGLHLPVLEDQTVRFRLELATEPEEVVTVDLGIAESGELAAWSENRSVFVFPADQRFAPPAPSRHVDPPVGFELVWVIDGTTRTGASGRPLLLESEEWANRVESLAALATAVSAEAPTRHALLAFGDPASPLLDALDLLPRYRLWPPSAERGELRRFATGDLGAELSAIPATAGADFVDALAEALTVCAELPRQDGWRRVVLVVGDSPGFSLADPAPEGADFLARAEVLEEALLRLHQQGTLVASIYLDSGAENDPAWSLRPDLPAFARRQYAELASLPSLAFTLPGLEPQAAAQAVRQVPEWVGFGFGMGEAT